MPARTIKPLLAVAIAYPFATWLLAAGLIIRSIIGDGFIDGSAAVMFISAPVAIAMLILYGIGNWMSGFRQQNEMPWWCLVLVLAWLACFVVIRRLAPARRANWTGH
jgi:hypothetical protein